MVNRRDFLEKHHERRRKGKIGLSFEEHQPVECEREKERLNRLRMGAQRSTRKPGKNTNIEGSAAYRGNQIIRASPFLLCMGAWLLNGSPCFLAPSLQPIPATPVPLLLPFCKALWAFPVKFKVPSPSWIYPWSGPTYLCNHTLLLSWHTGHLQQLELWLCSSVHGHKLFPPVCRFVSHSCAQVLPNFHSSSRKPWHSTSTLS